jgi:hypothetical protein
VLKEPSYDQEAISIGGFKFFYAIQNRGGRCDNWPTVIRSTTAIRSLKPNERVEKNAEIKFTLRGAQWGDYRFELVIDPEMRRRDRDRSNNVCHISFRLD